MRSRGAPVSYSTESPTSKLPFSKCVSKSSTPPPRGVFVGRIFGVHVWPHLGVRRGDYIHLFSFLRFSSAFDDPSITPTFHRPPSESRSCGHNLRGHSLEGPVLVILSRGRNAITYWTCLRVTFGSWAMAIQKRSIVSTISANASLVPGLVMYPLA